jgi:hypothetical protein
MSLALPLVCGGCKVYRLADVDRTPYTLIEGGQREQVFAIWVWSGVAVLPAPGRMHVVLVDQIPGGSKQSVQARAADKTPASRRLTNGEHSSDLYDALAGPAESDETSPTRWIVGNDPPVVAIHSGAEGVAANSPYRVDHAMIDGGHLVIEGSFRLVRKMDLEEQVDQVLVYALADTAGTPTRVVRRITFPQPVTLRKLYEETPWLRE